MNFKPELAAKVMAGEKTVTRRAVSNNPRSPWFVDRCALKIDHTYAVCPGRGKHAIGRVRIADVCLVPLAGVGLGEARAEGFDSVEAFYAAFNAINKNVDGGEWVWRVEFRVVHEPATAAWEGVPLSVLSDLADEAGFDPADCC